IVLRDGDKEQFEVKIGALPKDLAALGAPAEPEQPEQTLKRTQSQGMTLERLTAEQRSQLGLGGNGVRIAKVQDGAGARAGLQPGDVILAVGKQWVDSPAGL